MSSVQDPWCGGSDYEAFMGRWSRRLAPRFVAWINVADDLHWLDVGCGTGALTGAICGEAAPASVLGCDPAEPLVEFARQSVENPVASFAVAGAGGLPGRAHGYGCVASLLALNFFPDPAAAIIEMRRLASAGGTVAACVWDYAGGAEFLCYFWDAAAAVAPAAAELGEGRRFPICHPDPLTQLFSAGGLGDVRCEALQISTRFTSFDDYWASFRGGTGPAPAFVAGLDPDRRAALGRRLETALPRDADGAIDLVARAWAVGGTAG